MDVEEARGLEFRSTVRCSKAGTIWLIRTMTYIPPTTLNVEDILLVYNEGCAQLGVWDRSEDGSKTT